MIIVYHNSNFTDYYFRGVDELPADLLTKVAEVDSNDLEEAFELTNHIEHNWTENEEVTPLISNPRSTSCGDIMEIDGKFYIVASCGFKKINIFMKGE